MNVLDLAHDLEKNAYNFTFIKNDDIIIIILCTCVNMDIVYVDILIGENLSFIGQFLHPVGGEGME